VSELYRPSDRRLLQKLVSTFADRGVWRGQRNGSPRPILGFLYWTVNVDAPWYVPNSLIRRDLSCPTVKGEIRRYSCHYGDRLSTHPNHLAVNLLRLPENRRLRRFLPTDLPDRFKELLFVAILVLSYLLVSLVPY
jgi:hypothetical protein